jgi:hypothetical protein
MCLKILFKFGLTTGLFFSILQTQYRAAPINSFPPLTARYLQRRIHTSKLAFLFIRPSADMTDTQFVMTICLCVCLSSCSLLLPSRAGAGQKLQFVKSRKVGGRPARVCAKLADMALKIQLFVTLSPGCCDERVTFHHSK